MNAGRKRDEDLFEMCCDNARRTASRRGLGCTDLQHIIAVEAFVAVVLEIADLEKQGAILSDPELEGTVRRACDRVAKRIRDRTRKEVSLGAAAPLRASRAFGMRRHRQIHLLLFEIVASSVELSSAAHPRYARDWVRVLGGDLAIAEVSRRAWSALRRACSKVCERELENTPREDPDYVWIRTLRAACESRKGPSAFRRFVIAVISDPPPPRIERVLRRLFRLSGRTRCAPGHQGWREHLACAG